MGRSHLNVTKVLNEIEAEVESTLIDDRDDCFDDYDEWGLQMTMYRWFRLWKKLRVRLTHDDYQNMLDNAIPHS